jgi:UDP-glucose 4-epimerase
MTLLVTVTGAQGRIGGAVIPQLVAAGHEIQAVDRAPAAQEAPGVRRTQADVCDYDQLREAVDGSDAVVHLAAINSPRGQLDHEVHHTNVTGSYNALAAAVDADITQVVLASSINAIGGAFSRAARYDYFPVDERHPCYAEDPYGLSKWIGEQQADAVARRYADLTISSLRIHAAVPDRDWAVAHLDDVDPVVQRNHLWGYTTFEGIGRAVLLSLRPQWRGHEVFTITAPDTALETDSVELARRWWPEVPLRRELRGNGSFFDCGKAGRLLGWEHP